MPGSKTVARAPISEAFPGNATLANLLLRTGFRYLDEVAECSTQDLLTIRGCGEKSIVRIKTTLLDRGLDLPAQTEGASPFIVSPDGTTILRKMLDKEHVRSWVKLSDTQDLASQSPEATLLVYGWITFRQFMDASPELRRALYTPRGIQKIEAFIAEHNL